MRGISCAAAVAALSLSAVSTASPSLEQQRALDAALQEKSFGRVAISRDGQWIAYELRREVADSSPARSAQIWVHDRRTGRTIRVGEQGESTAPQWSPRGGLLAFVSSTEGRPSLHSVDIVTGKQTVLIEPEPTAGATLAIDNFKWSPSGDRIAFQLSTSRPNAPRNPEPWEGRVFFFTGVKFGMDTPPPPVEGRLGVVAVRFREVRYLNGAEFLPSAGESLDWSPDGRSVLVSGRTDRESADTDLFVINASSGKRRRLGGTEGKDIGATFVGPAEVIFTSWWNGPEDFSRSSPVLELLDCRTSAVRRVSALFPDFQFGDKFAPLFTGGPLSLAPAAPGSHKVYYATLINQSLRLVALDFQHGRVELPGPPGRSVQAFAIAADEDTAALVISGPNDWPELFVGSLHAGQFKQITHVFDDERARLRLSRIEPVEWQAADGRFTIHGFLAVPAEQGASQPYPLIVSIHGGPGGSYSDGFAELRSGMSKTEFYTSRGYAVLLPNPRGSWSFGEAFMDALRDRASSLDMDIDPGVDELISRGVADKDRLLIRGHSYGAYAAAWITTRSQRYRAAYLDDGIYDFFSMYGSSYPYYDGWHRHFLRGSPWENRDRYIQDSPVTFANLIRTPSFIRSGAATEPGVKPLYDSPFVSQARELYGTLRHVGTPVELMIDLLQAHAAMGEQQYENLEREGDWFDFWLGKQDGDPAKIAQYARWRALRSGAR